MVAAAPPADEPTDAALVAAHRAGDRDAAGLLVVRHHGLIRKAVKSCGRIPSVVDVDDLISAGQRAIWLCAKAGHWDPAGGSKFSTYAWVAIHNAVRREIRDQEKAVRGLVADADVPEDAPAPAPPPDVAPVLAAVDPLGRRILAGTYGLSGTPEGAAAIGRRVGLTAPQVRKLRDAALAAARKKVAGPGS